MSSQEITTAIAIWGAVTGTIGTIAGLLGLWLRFRQHSLDKPKLNCESSFGFESPTHNKHKIIIRSLGRRPVSIDFVRYFIVPHNKWQRLLKKWQHRKGRWLWDQGLKNQVKLTEGEKAEVKISLPNGIEIQEIYRVEVIDQSGRHWHVMWPSKFKLTKIATQKQLDFFEDQTDKRVCSATGYRLGKKYYLETKFNTKPSRMGVTCGRSFWLMDVKNYREKLQDVKEKQFPKYLSGEVEEIV